MEISELLKNDKAVFLAYDHGLEHGPEDFLNEKTYSPNFILELAYTSKFQAVIFQKGTAEKFYYKSKWSSKIPLILKINGKTKWQNNEPYSPVVCSPEYAKNLGASAIGYTLYPGSKREAEMFKEFGRVSEEAKKIGLPVIAWVYPRGEKINDENSPDVVQYAARIALELGADMAKIKYSGSTESFKKAIEVSWPIKIMLSGGSKLPENEFLKVVESVIEAGANGVAVGRNIWQSDDPFEISKKIYNIVFGFNK